MLAVGGVQLDILRDILFPNCSVTNESEKNFRIKIFEIVGKVVKIWANKHKCMCVLFKRLDEFPPPFYNDDEKCRPPWIGSLFWRERNLFSRSCLPIFRAKLPVQYFCHYVFSWQSLYILDFSDKGTAQASGILLLQNGCKHIFFPNKNSMCIYTLNLAIFVFTSELIMIFWLGFWKNLG